MNQSDSTTIPTQQTWLRIALVIVGIAFFVCGCSVQRPETPGEYPPPDQEPKFANTIPHEPDTSVVPIDPEEETKNWTEIGGGTVLPEDSEKTVSGGRYELTFPRGSVTGETEITISQFSSEVLVIELGPHGTVFAKPVELTIDYSGTNVDPASPHFTGEEPVFFWYNPSEWRWEEIPGTNDPETLTYTVKLDHFSLYGLGDGTSGWELPIGH